MRRRAVVFGLDGARGDLIAEAIRCGAAPNIATIPSIVPCDSCAGRCARPQDGPNSKSLPGAQWKTTPGWSSVLMGVNNDKHCVIDNTSESVLRSWAASKAYPAFLAHGGMDSLAVGRPTVIGSGGKVGILDPYKTHIRWNSETVSTGHAGEVRNVNFVIDALRSKSPPSTIFVHLDGIDQAGHEYGWGSRQQNMAIQDVDREVGRVLDALDFKRWNTLIIITADHGGHDKMHGTMEKTDSCIPFMTNAVLGPRTTNAFARGVEPRQFDACTTVCSFMGYPTDGQDGRNLMD